MRFDAQSKTIVLEAAAAYRVYDYARVSPDYVPSVFYSLPEISVTKSGTTVVMDRIDVSYFEAPPDSITDLVFESDPEVASLQGGELDNRPSFNCSGWGSVNGARCIDLNVSGDINFGYVMVYGTMSIDGSGSEISVAEGDIAKLATARDLTLGNGAGSDSLSGLRVGELVIKNNATIDVVPNTNPNRNWFRMVTVDGTSYTGPWRYITTQVAGDGGGSVEARWNGMNVAPYRSGAPVRVYAYPDADKKLTSLTYTGAGTGTYSVDGSANPYEFYMPDEDAVVTAAFGTYGHAINTQITGGTGSVTIYKSMTSFSDANKVTRSKALDDVNLEVRRGEIHAVCGENGAGKSTLMNVLSGVLPYGSYEGTIIYEGVLRTFRTIRDSEAAGIGFIHQELTLVPTLSVAENVFLGNERASRGVIDWGATEAEACEHLRKVELDIPARTPVSELGIGQQQLLEIAKALSKDVRLLILDEPTAALNDVDSARLLDLMRSLREQGITMALISHKLSEVVSIADRVTVIRDGKTVATAPLHGEGAIGEDDIVRLMVGRELTSRFPEHTPHIGDEVFRLSHWTVYHATDPARKAVDDVSLALRRGEVVGLAGLVGSGRTALAMSLFGRSRGARVSGTAYKDGAEISTSSVSRAIDAGLAYVTEDRRGLGLNLIQDIKTNTTAVALDKVSRHKVVDGSAEERVA